MSSQSRCSFATTAAALLALCPISPAAHISDHGDGWSWFNADYKAELRHLASNASDFEIGLGDQSWNFDETAHASWNKGVNSFAVTFNASTSEMTVALNDASATWTTPGNPARINLQLIARNGRFQSAQLAVANLTMNGNPVAGTARAAGAMVASNMPGTTASSNFTWLTIDDVPAQGDWTLAGNVNTNWTGGAPTRGNTRLDFGFAVPEPGSLALVATAALGAVTRRRK